MNKHQQLRVDLHDIDRLVNHDFRIMSSLVDAKEPPFLDLVIEDAYGPYKARFMPEGPIKPSSLIGNVHQMWGFPMDHEHPEFGLLIDFMERPENKDPNLLVVPRSACADEAVPALHGLIDILEQMPSRPIARFVHRVLGSDNVYPYFFKARASREAHHAFPGGLAIHSHECAVIVAGLSAATFANQESKDTAIAAAILHDLGKIEWIRSAYNNPLIMHETRSVIEIATELPRLRAETHAACADMLTYLISKEARCEHAACPEAVAVAMADRLSATRDGQIAAFKASPRHYATADRRLNGQLKRYIRIQDRDGYPS
ncbi:HD domain-containing protein [Nevskia sp.]|uniref:HD domain-containing protein n=1 Tax=Nevskia sp. TaxID=1929292 RepID=UPI0025FE887A|nr:HD domain-containing protein [Nevskia sp.]